MSHSVSPRLLVSAPRKVTAPKIIKKKQKKSQESVNLLEIINLGKGTEFWGRRISLGLA